jgi:hypothetical protein
VTEQLKLDGYLLLFVNSNHVPGFKSPSRTIALPHILSMKTTNIENYFRAEV